MSQIWDVMRLKAAIFHPAARRAIKDFLILHAFVKKTRKTPTYEMDIARLRLKEMLDEEKK